MVPNGWKEIKLKDIGLCITGLTYSPKNVVENGLLVLRSSNVQGSKLAFEDNVYVNLEIAEKAKTKYGDILLCVRNGSRRLIGKSALINKTSEGYAHGAFMGLFRSKDTPEYTFQMFQSSRFFKQVNQNIGATINSINSGNLYHFKFPYPPITERNRIAKILGTWDKAISTTERLIDNSKQQKKALMQQLLTGKKRLLDDSGKPFEAKWEEAKLSDIGKVSIGLVTTMTKHYVKDGVPLIRNSDIKPNIIKKAKMLRLCEDFSNSYDSRKLKKGDVVTVHTGEVGVSAVIDDELDGCMGFATLNTRPNINKVNPEYLSWYFNSELFIYWCISMSTGDGRQNLNLKDFVKAKIHLPCLLEQEKIVAVLVNADNEILILEQQLADLKQEKKALMQQLLTGKRRVTIDEAEVA